MEVVHNADRGAVFLPLRHMFCCLVLLHFNFLKAGLLASPFFLLDFGMSSIFTYFPLIPRATDTSGRTKSTRKCYVCTGLKNAHRNFHKWLNSQISHGWAWDSGYPSCTAAVFVEASILDRCWAAVLAFTSILNLHKRPLDFFSAFDIN